MTDERTTVAESIYGLLTATIRRGDRQISLTSAATMATLQRTGPRRITDLAAVEGVTQPSMTSLVSALERAGYVTRERHPDDQRAVLVALTPAGADYLRSRRRGAAEHLVRLIDKLPADEVAALVAAAPALAHLHQLDDEERAGNA